MPHDRAQAAGNVRSTWINKVHSKDGTPIAFDRSGQGPAVVVVGDAFQHRANDPRRRTWLSCRRSTSPCSTTTVGVAATVEIRRRSRSSARSKTSTPSSTKRGDWHLCSVTPPGNRALEAARGLAITKLALWEPNFLVDDSRPPLPKDYVARLIELVSASRRDDAVEYFMTKAVGLPAEFLTPMRNMPI